MTHQRAELTQCRQAEALADQEPEVATPGECDAGLQQPPERLDRDPRLGVLEESWIDLRRGERTPRADTQFGQDDRKRQDRPDAKIAESTPWRRGRGAGAQHRDRRCNVGRLLFHLGIRHRHV